MGLGGIVDSGMAGFLDQDREGLTTGSQQIGTKGLFRALNALTSMPGQPSLEVDL